MDLNYIRNRQKNKARASKEQFLISGFTCSTGRGSKKKRAVETNNPPACIIIQFVTG